MNIGCDSAGIFARGLCNLSPLVDYLKRELISSFKCTCYGSVQIHLEVNLQFSVGRFLDLASMFLATEQDSTKYQVRISFEFYSQNILLRLSLAPIKDHLIMKIVRFIVHWPSMVP